MTTTITRSSERDPEEVAGELAGRLFEAGLGAFELATVTLGERLGLYRALADHGPSTSQALAAASRIDARYVREWCEQQAAAGLLGVDDPRLEPERRQFHLPPGSEAVLLDPQSPAYAIPLGGFLEAVGRILPAVEAAFRTGAGIPYADYGVHDVQGAFNRPAFSGQLVQEWLPQIPDLDAALRAGGTVAEFGCGEGWAAIALAVGYPRLFGRRVRHRPTVDRRGTSSCRTGRGRRPCPLRRRRCHRPGAHGQLRRCLRVRDGARPGAPDRGTPDSPTR